MAITFTPNGLLDVATDPSDLPEQIDGKVAASGAMIRCTNLNLDRMGMASTRRGTTKLNASAIQPLTNLIEQGGVRYGFGGGSAYKNEASIDTGLDTADFSSVLYNPYNMTTQAVYALNGVDRIKVEDATVYEWGIEAPTAAPIIHADPAYVCTHAADQVGIETTSYIFTTLCDDSSYVTFGWEKSQVDLESVSLPETRSYIDTYLFENNMEYGIDGIFEIVYTYARYEDGLLVCESDPSPAIETTIATSLVVQWANSTDAQVNAVRVYRSIANTAGQWLYAGVFADTQNVASIGLRDDELGTQVDTDHTRPPLGTMVIGPSLGGQLYIIKDNLLYYSRPLQPEYWPATYYVEVSPIQLPLKSACFFGGNLFLATEMEIYLVSGSGANSYFPQPMSAITGTKSANCFVPVKGTGIFHLGADGIYVYTAGQDVSLTDSMLRPIFEGTTKGSIPGLNQDNIGNCLMIQYLNKLWFGYPATAETYCKDWLVYDIGTKRLVHYQYPWAITCIAIDNNGDRLIGCDENGYVLVIDDSTATADDSTAITYDLESKEFNQFPKYFPRYARWDVNLGTGGSATGSVRLNSVAVQSHTIRTSRDTKKRLIATSTGTRLSVRVSGTGPVDIYGVQVE